MVKAETKNKERISRKTPSKNTTKQDDSITKVHLNSNVEPYKYINGHRLPIAIRIDKGLYKQFKPLAKRVYGSVCRAVEIYMISCIDAVEKGNVHFSNTEKPLHIGKIVIERNLRPRRKLEISDDSNDLACYYCGKSAVGDFRYLKTGEVFPLCEFHAKVNLESKNWKVVSDG